MLRLPEILDLNPFPHAVIDDALDNYDELVAEFPSFDTIRGDRPIENNKLYLLTALKVIDNPDISEKWREFFRYHISDEFKRVVVEQDVALDCQFGVNSPVTEPSTVRTPHVDNSKKLFSMLLYCRHPDDNAPGGDLVLYSREGTQIREARRIPYAANRLVFMYNSSMAVHGVTARPPTQSIRRYINISGEVQRPLFNNKHHWMTFDEAA